MKNFLAALTLFTRIPAWRLADLTERHYRKAVVFWPLTGWVTGCVAGGMIFAFSYVMPVLPAVVLGLSARLLLTCALHEDGLADFCDGFGGGADKNRILSIMKDSHIGTYGVIGLIACILLDVSMLASLPASAAALAIIAADPFSKLCASQIINTLDYARPEGAKNKILYDKMTVSHFSMNLVFGIVPVLPLLLYDTTEIFSILFPVLTMVLLVRYLRRKIAGYTGDCCGASYLICESAMLTGIVVLFSL